MNLKVFRQRGSNIGVTRFFSLCGVLKAEANIEHQAK